MTNREVQGKDPYYNKKYLRLLYLENIERLKTKVI